MSRSLFHDKLWKRANLAAWDQKWHALSVTARERYLSDLNKNFRQDKTPRPHVAPQPDSALDELEQAGFLVVRREARGSRVLASEEAKEFSHRLQTLIRCHLLESNQNLPTYVRVAFDYYGFSEVAAKITMEATEVSRYELPGDPINLFVPGPRWVGWVADHLKLPLARKLADALRKAGGQHPVSRLGELVPGASAESLRAAYDALVNHLALVEGVDPATHEIVAGYLPAVRACWTRTEEEGAKPVSIPPDVTAGAIGPLVADLRAVLLEMSAGSVQLKQGGHLFAKEEARLIACLPEQLLPVEAGDEGQVIRLNTVFTYASRLGLVERKQRGSKQFLEMRGKASAWLRAGLEQQHSEVFALCRTSEKDRWSYAPPSDASLLGTSMIALPQKAGKKVTYPRTKYDPEPVRKALQAAFESLPEEVFFDLEVLLRHFSGLKTNPFLLGRPITEVALFLGSRTVVPLEEIVESTTRRALTDLIHQRLIPLGCLRVGVGRAGEMLVARLPRLSRYFDGSPPPAETLASEECRVIVQPDFSIIVIGLNPGPAAELAQFTSRDRSANTPGAVIFHLTREDVFRGMKSGLTGKQMVATLQRLSSTPVPNNIEMQLQGWAGQGRVVSTLGMLVIRCPDAACADRVMGAMSKHGERLGPQAVGLPGGKLPSALRQKLLAQGIMVESD